MSPKLVTEKAPKKATAKADKPEGFTGEERAAMQEHVRELKRARSADGSDEEKEVLAKIASMPPADRLMAERLHAIITAAAPSLTAKTWYGMPAYARNGQVVCFFQSSQKFKTRYSTLGFSDKAKLDEGHIWPTSFALTELTPTDEEWIASLIQKAIR